jgi:hypothetical protein
LLSQRSNVGPHLAHHIATGQKCPPLKFMNIKIRLEAPESRPQAAKITLASRNTLTGLG